MTEFSTFRYVQKLLKTRSTVFVRLNQQYWKKYRTFQKYSVARVEISLPFLISSWVLVGPGLEFPSIEKTNRGAVSTRLVFLH